VFVFIQLFCDAVSTEKESMLLTQRSKEQDRKGCEALPYFIVKIALTFTLTKVLAAMP
jgi:hypothetical protein